MSGDIPIHWQVRAVERAVAGAEASAWFHEQRGDDQARTARLYAVSLKAALDTLTAMEIGGKGRAKKVANG